MHTHRLSTATVTAAIVPLLFVVIWSTGFISAKFGLPYAEPATFLAYRFTVVAVILIVIGLIWRTPWPASITATLHIAVTGILILAVNLGCVFYALALGTEAGVIALIAALQPLLTAVVAGRMIGERVSPRQWLGFILGLIGVGIVVTQKLQPQDSGTIASTAGIILSFAGLIGLSLGVVYQKRYCQELTLISGTAIQTTAAAIAMWAVALALETRDIDWTLPFILAFIWLSLFLSIGAIMLLSYLLRHGQASRVSSLFYLIPVSTALMAYAFFGETFGALSLFGMLLAIIGVALVNRQ